MSEEKKSLQPNEFNPGSDSIDVKKEILVDEKEKEEKKKIKKHKLLLIFLKLLTTIHVF